MYLMVTIMIYIDDIHNDIHYVKRIIESEFHDNVIFLTISPIEPLVVIAKISHTSGELFHTSNRQQMIKVTAQMMREIVNEYVENEKKTDSVWPPTVESLRSTRASCPPLRTSFFTQLLKTKGHSVGEC